MSYVLRVKEPGRHETFAPLKGDELSIGRLESNDFSYPERKALSRKHAVFTRAGDAWRIEDCGSSNGTFVNKERLAGPHMLRHGDRVQVADLEFVFEASRTPTADAFEFSAGTMEFNAHTTNLQTVLAKAKTPGKDSTDGLAARTVTALLRVGRELGVSRPLDELFETILTLATEAVGARRGLLMTLDESQLLVRARRGDDFRISQRVRNQVIDEKLSLIIADAQADPDWESHQSIVAQGIRSLLAAPLQTDDRVIGLLYLDSWGGSRLFSEQDLELITVMANVAAIRIERERLEAVEKSKQVLEFELNQAAEIQRQCLPGEPPQVPGFDLAGFSRPCRTVGGDYYGFFPRPDGRVCVVLGDVAGKGMPASLLMMNLQARVQILAETNDDPAAIVDRLNRTLHPICPGNRFVTLFVSILDPRTGEIEYCNAGHEPPLWVKAKGGVEPLTAGGPVIGLFPALPFEGDKRTLEVGDAVVMFTDGITEASSPQGTEFGTERIGQAFAARTGASARGSLAALESLVIDWLSGRPAHDDVTAVALVRTPV